MVSYKWKLSNIPPALSRRAYAAWRPFFILRRQTQALRHPSDAGTAAPGDTIQKKTGPAHPGRSLRVENVAAPRFRGGCAALCASGSAFGGPFDTCSARGMFCHAQVAAEHDPTFFAACGRRTWRHPLISGRTCPSGQVLFFPFGHLLLRPPPRLPSMLRFRSAIFPSEEERNCLSLSSNVWSPEGDSGCCARAKGRA